MVEQWTSVSFEVTSMLWLGLAVLAQTASTGQPPRDYNKGCTETGCHDEFSKRAVVHNPVETGVCDACHEPVDGEVHKFRWVEEGGDLCLECHEELRDRIETVETIHEPVEDGCLDCHNPHGGAVKALLVDIKDEDIRTLCFECHEDEILRQQFLHGPADRGACNVCHDPHGSSISPLLPGPVLPGRSRW